MTTKPVPTPDDDEPVAPPAVIGDPRPAGVEDLPAGDQRPAGVEDLPAGDPRPGGDPGTEPAPAPSPEPEPEPEP